MVWDVPPPAVASNTFHLDQAERQDTAECRRNYADEVEDGVSFADLVTCVPSREQINRAREEPVMS